MAQAGGYKHDIFISYAHDDNHVPGDDEQGWVDQFHLRLESWLSKRRGLANLSIWRDDRRMNGNTLFDDAIEEAVKGSALFFALVSRNYLQSDYCRKELSKFHRHNSAHPAGLKVEDRCRIFTILLNNIPRRNYQQWSPALEGTTGFVFHDAASDKDLGDFIAIKDDRFEKKLRPIVDAVESMITPLAAQPPAPETKEALPSYVYIANTAETLQPFRYRIVAELQGRGFEVLSGIPPPWNDGAHAAQVRRSLDQARYSVHLFDQWQGPPIIDRPQNTYPQEQLNLARESAALPLIWVPPELDLERIENETQRRFLRACAHDLRRAGEYEFVRAPQIDFIHLILEKLAHPLPATPPDMAARTYLVDTHQKDQRHAFELAGYLAGLGVTVDFNHESENPVVSRSKFEDAVCRVRHLIIIFGQVAPEWLHARIKLALKIICNQFDCESPCCLENIWVYRVPASRDTVRLPPLPPIIKIRVLDNSHSPRIEAAVADQLLVAPSAGGGL